MTAMWSGVNPSFGPGSLVLAPKGQQEPQRADMAVSGSGMHGVIAVDFTRTTGNQKAG